MSILIFHVHYSMNAAVALNLVAIATSFGFPMDWEVWKKVSEYPTREMVMCQKL